MESKYARVVKFLRSYDYLSSQLGLALSQLMKDAKVFQQE
jgi:hypothetical protein